MRTAPAGAESASYEDGATGEPAPLPLYNELKFSSYRNWASDSYFYLASLELLGLRSTTGSLVTPENPDVAPPPYKSHPRSGILVIPEGAVELEIGAPIVSAKLRSGPC